MFTVNLFTYWRVKLCEKIFHFICTLKAIIQALRVCLQASNVKLSENNMMCLFANQSAI